MYLSNYIFVFLYFWPSYSIPFYFNKQFIHIRIIFIYFLSNILLTMEEMGLKLLLEKTSLTSGCLIKTFYLIRKQNLHFK